MATTVGTGDECAPAHVRTRPTFINRVIAGYKQLAAAPAKVPVDLLGRALSADWRTDADTKIESCVMTVPLYCISPEAFAVPGVYPLEQQLQQVKEHWYPADVWTFPPRGAIMEVVTYHKPLQACDLLGGLHRVNLEKHLLAFVLKFMENKDDAVKVNHIRQVAGSILVKINLCKDESANILLSYQHREDDEKTAEIGGHSPLERSRTISAIQDVFWQTDAAHTTHDHHRPQ